MFELFSQTSICSFPPPPHLAGSLQSGGFPLLVMNELQDVRRRGYYYTRGQRGSWMTGSGMRELTAAAFTDESRRWSLACEIQREERLWFVEAVPNMYR